EAVKKVDSMVNSDGESEVEEVFNETGGFMASTSLNSGSKSRYDTKSLLERWRETKVGYEYDPYDDDLYDGHDVSENLHAICDDWDIKVTNKKEEKDGKEDTWGK
ncbi:hypothetical protein Tco_0558119, partial [Tanacetum coccineum]